MTKKKIMPPKLDEDFYINTVGVNDWLHNKGENQVIRFSNRMEYKKNNIYHRDDGPAIDFFSGVGNRYYLEGVNVSEEEHKNYRRTLLIDKMS